MWLACCLVVIVSIGAIAEWLKFSFYSISFVCETVDLLRGVKNFAREKSKAW